MRDPHNLFTPGPTPVPTAVTKAMSRKTIHHRTSEFLDIFKDAASRYSQLIGTEKLSLLLAGSGSLAMNAALDNCLPTKGEVLVFSAGKFGERWYEIASSMHKEVTHITLEWGTSVTPEIVLAELEKRPDVSSILLQHCETSTGVLFPIEEILATVKKHNPKILTFVDGITSIGVVPINFDDGLIDVLVCGSQKGLMLPPGLSMLTLSDLAWDAAETKNSSQYYWDLRAEKAVQVKGITKWTPATTLVIGLQKSLELIEEEGYSQLYKRHSELAAFTREQLIRLGFSLFAKTHPAVGLTSVLSPEGVNAAELRASLWEKYGIRVAGGQAEYQDRIMRVAHMGHYEMNDLKYCLAKIEELIQ